MAWDNSKLTQGALSKELVSVGKALPFDVFAKNGFLLMKKGYYILTDEQKNKLLKIGVTQIEADTPQDTPAAAEPASTRSLQPNPFEEMSHLYLRARGLLRDALSIKDFPAAILALAQHIIQQTEILPDAMIAGILLVPFRDYTPAHSVHTAVLLALLTRRMNLPSNHREILLCAALTMNIASVQLQNELFSQQADLDEEQQQAIQAHPLLGSAILREAGVSDELWHTLVQTHHESWTGKGYPYGLERSQILPPAHILRLADVACAKLTPRRYRSALLPATALGHIFQRKDNEFDSAFTTLLIKELGIYPPGGFVKLANDEIGVVTHRGNKPSTPQVAALSKVNGMPYGEPLIRESRNPAFKVIEPCSSQLCSVRPHYLGRLWSS
jgi:HD-GYP domain-containing protein (c-di-GMP phosphodiesterase class II)